MKNAVHHPSVRNSIRTAGRSYAGRRTLERIYRRIAASNVVGTLTRARRSVRGHHRSSRQPRSSKTSWASSASSLVARQQHPQSGVLKSHDVHLSQLRLERTKSRRRAREQKLKRVWENDVLSSASDEVIQEGHHALAQHPTRLVHSTFELAECPNMLSGSEETSGTNTDDSSLKYLTERRCGSSGNRSGCSSPGYFPQLFCSMILSLGNLNIGYSLAYHALAPANHLPEDAPAWLLPWTQNLFNLGGLLGGLLSAFALTKGRKRPLIFFVLVSTGAWLMVILAHTSSMIFGARLIAGVTAGVVMVLNQVYIAEISSPFHRGAFGVLPTIFGLSGTLACFGLSYVALWSTISIVGAVANAPYLLLLIFYLPESTRFLIKTGKIPAGVVTMEKLGTTCQLAGIRDSVELFKLAGNYKLSSRQFIVPVIISASLMFFSQFSGVDGVLTYASDRFRDHRHRYELMSNLPVVVLYAVQLAAALICFATIDRKGRRSLLLVSAAAAAAALLALGLYLLFEDIGRALELRWIPMACVIVYCGAFALGLGPIPWVVLGEFSPRKNQGAAAGIAATCFWGPSIIITASFGDMQSAMYLSGTFWFYTIFCVFGYLFVLLVLPDLRSDATMEQIQLFFLAKAQEAERKKRNKSRIAEDPWSFSSP